MQGYLVFVGLKDFNNESPLWRYNSELESDYIKPHSDYDEALQDVADKFEKYGGLTVAQAIIIDLKLLVPVYKIG